MRSRFLLLWVVAAFAVAALAVAPTAHVAHASTSGLVISAMYAGGGDITGPGDTILAPYTNDYIELFNAGASPVDINGWSVQYRHADGTSWQKTQFTTSTIIQPGRYFLIQAFAGTDGAGVALPTPDATNAANMRRTGDFMVALMSTLDTIIGDNPYTDINSMDDVEDFFGGGHATTSLPPAFETAVRTGILDNTTAWFRNNGGCQDTDNNLNDFASGPVAGAARNSASPANVCAASADLVVAVTDAPDPVLTGEAITYTVNVDNVGAAAANNAVISVGMTGSAYPGTVTALSNNTECSFTNPTITCNVASIPTSGSFTFTFQVTPAVAGTVTANATVSADAPETTGNNAGSASTTVNSPAIPSDVSVTIADTPDPVIVGNAVAYTVTVNNTGASGATGTVLTVVLGGTAFPGTVDNLTGTGCSFNASTVTCNIGALAATNGTTNVTFNVTPTVDGNITANATVSADAPETAGNNTDSETTTVNPVPTTADVSVTIADSPDPVVVGNAVAYTVTVNNTGTGAAANTTLDVVLGGTAFPGTVTDLTGTGCSFAASTVSCNIGALAATNGTTNVTFNVTPTVDGNITADATVAADEPETGGNNTDSETTTVNPPVVTGATGTIESTETITSGGTVTVTVTDGDLTAETSVLVSAVGSSGDNESLTLNVTGTPGTFSGTFTVADAAPVVTNGTLEESGGTITFTYVDALDTEGDVNTSLSDVTTVEAVPPTIGSFDLVSPHEGEILRTADVTFSWTEATGANSYTVYLSHLSTNTRIGETYTEVVASTACVSGVCSVASSDLVADLEHGTYSWTVIATEGTIEAEATDGPNLFTVVVDTGVELVVNGGFEDGATGWVFANGGKRRCAAFGNNSDCALNLRPGATAVQNGQMTEILANLDSTAGDVLQVSASVRTNSATRQRPVLVTIIYADSNAGVRGNGRDKIKLFVEETTTGYETFSTSFVLADTIVGGKVVVRNTLPAGKIRVDDVSVILAPIGTAPRAEAPASADGVLPLPAAPDNFRGNN